MSTWVRSSLGRIGGKAWALGILGFVLLPALARAELVTYRTAGVFTQKTYGTTPPLCAVGDTFTADFTYDTDTPGTFLGTPPYARYAKAVKSARAVVRRNGTVVFTGEFSSVAQSDIYVMSNYGAFPNTDNFLVYLPLVGTATNGNTTHGTLRLRISGPVGSLTTPGLPLPSLLPESTDMTSLWSFGGESLTGTVSSLTHIPPVPEYVAWMVEGQINMVSQYGNLAGIAQVGDTVSVTYYLRTNVADANPGNERIGQYDGSVLMANVVIEHDGEAVWAATYSYGTNLLNLFLDPVNWDPMSTQWLRLDCRMDELVDTGAADCQVALSLYDRDVADMALSDSFPALAPEACERGILSLNLGGSEAARANLLPAQISVVDLSDDAVYLDTISRQLDTVQTLTVEIAAKDQEILQKDSQIATMQAQADTLVAEKAVLIAEKAALQQQLDQLIGTGYVAWKYEAQITQVLGSSPGVDLQVGDMVSGFRIMRTDRTDQYPEENRALYEDVVVLSETRVTRGGVTVWRARHSHERSKVVQDISIPGRQTVYCYDDQREPGTPKNIAPYVVVVDFIDTVGGDMLATDAMLTAPPANWETGYVHIRTYGGTNLARADLLTSGFSHLSLADHVGNMQQMESLEQQVDQLVGTGLAAWKYQAMVTGVTPGCSLDGVIQGGDTISGYRILHTDLEDTDPAAGHAMYNNTVVASETMVTRNGASVWQAAHAGLTSNISLYTTSPQQVYFYDDQRVPDGDSAVYSVVVRFLDSSGSDMLDGERIPAMPPANWESAFVYVRENGAIIVTAQLLPDGLSLMSLPDHVAKRQELEAEVTGLEQQVAQLVGAGFAAWKYQATVTSVVPGYGLDGVIQTGDIISGNRILRTDLEDTDPDIGRALYQNTVVASETTVTRNGTDVWQAAHASMSSNVLLFLHPYMPPPRAYFYDDQKLLGDEDSPVYSVVVHFLDSSGVDMLADGSMPTMPPANWESAFVYIRVGGMNVVTAQLLPDGLSLMSLPDHVAKRLELEAEIAGLQQDVASLESEVSAFEQQLAAANADIAAKQAQIDALTADLATANADIAAKQAQIDTLTASLAAANADIAAKQAQIDTLTASLADANADIAAKQAQIGALTVDLATANADIVAKQAQIDALTADLATANADIAAKQAQIDVLTAEKAALQQQLAAANADIATLTASLADANADIAAKQAQIDVLTAEKAALQQQLDAANADIATLTASLADANADIAAKQAQIDVLAAEKAALQQQLDAANADIAAKQAQIDVLLAEKAALQQQLAAANADIATLTAALQQANADIAALQQNVAELEADNAAYDAQVTAISGSMTTLGSTLAAEFNNPSFVMPGNTPEEQAENLKAALLSLNPGQRQALFKALGGVKNGN